LTGIKEGQADCIRIDGIAAALKKMKSHKALKTQACQAVAEIIQATEDWKSTVVVLITSERGSNGVWISKKN